MKKVFFTLLILLSVSASFANHLKGGFFTYEYLGAGVVDPTKLRYKVVLTVYMECNASDAQVGGNINYTVFDGSTGQFVQDIDVPIKDIYNLSKGQDEVCITGSQDICYYKIVVYEKVVELAKNNGGYTFSYQRCCRIAGIMNIPNSSAIGNTYSITMPGGANSGNSSAKFQVNDTVVVCGGSYFEYPFLATDPDGDRLSYSFCDAWIGGSSSNAQPTTASAPPYSSVSYNFGFSGSQPLGPQVTIDPNTGLIKGAAPAIPGEYVVTVCVSEIKNNTVIATTRKELHIKVGDCVPIKAVLDPVYPTCDGFTRTFSNNIPPNNSITSYYWEFGDGNSSSNQNPTHTYADTGVYNLKLVVNRGGQCSDSSTALVKVFPGFFPGFSFAGICVNKPTQFTDTTKTNYGVVDSWKWNFGDQQNPDGTSSAQHPSYTYSTLGPKKVEFIVTNSKGCIDTVVNTVTIIDKPDISVAFKDTLICNGDQLQLKAMGMGSFSWTPNANMQNPNTATPVVSPAVTTKYTVQLNDNGCINQEEVNVKVVNFVTLQPLKDTTICQTDSVQLFASTDGLQFSWTPTPTLNNPNIQNPKARPLQTTTYQVTATIGHCNATDDVTVHVVPYPVSNAGADTTICYGTTAQLNGSITGSSFVWTPTETLTNLNTLNPIAQPPGTTKYVLTVKDVLGCPKPVSDTVLVTVLPQIHAFAGNDTSVVIGQPLQLLATGGEGYTWTPPTYLNKINVPNPIGIYDGNLDSLRYTVYVNDAAGCVDSAYVTVRVFKTNPKIFVPSAFTPNGDGKNDVIRPIAVGISKIEYFRIYNRWGQLVFSTTRNGHGWDGRINGKDQGTNTYVWVVRGVDFTGKTVTDKGTVTLIR